MSSVITSLALRSSSLCIGAVINAFRVFVANEAFLLLPSGVKSPRFVSCPFIPNEVAVMGLSSAIFST